MREPDEIEAQRSEANAALIDNNGASRWPGMTYEQGVSNALGWVLDDLDEPPMEDA